MHFENKPHIFFRFTVFNYKRKYDIIKSIHLIIAQLTEYENCVSYSLFIVVWNAIFWWCQFMPYCNILMWQITFFKNNYHSISHPTCPSRTLTLTHQERRLCPFLVFHKSILAEFSFSFLNPWVLCIFPVIRCRHGSYDGKQQKIETEWTIETRLERFQSQAEFRFYFMNIRLF